MRVVLDTNIFVSSYLNVSGAPGRIRSAFQSRKIDVIVSEELLKEYRRVLSYPRVAKLHHMSPEEIGKEIDGLREAAIVVPLAEVPNLIPEDPADNAVIATAVSGEATYVISGDEDLHRLGSYRGIRILRARVFVAFLDF